MDDISSENIINGIPTIPAHKELKKQHNIAASNARVYNFAPIHGPTDVQAASRKPYDKQNAIHSIPLKPEPSPACCFSPNSPANLIKEVKTKP